MLPAVTRIVAIGDLHGDMDKTRRAFRVGGLIDEHDRWAGGTTTAVQVLSRWNHRWSACRRWPGMSRVSPFAWG